MIQPTIASYTDFSARSVHKIQPRYEALKVGKKVRKFKSQSTFSKPARPKTSDKLSMNEIVLIDTNIPESEPKTQKPTKPKFKPSLDNKSEYPKLEWNFKPWSKHRENWLFMRVKPESEFTPKRPVKKIPVSFAAVLVKNAIDTTKEQRELSASGLEKDKSEKLSWSRVSNASAHEQE